MARHSAAASMLRKYVNILTGVSTNELITRCSFAYSGKPAGQDLLAAGERNGKCGKKNQKSITMQSSTKTREARSEGDRQGCESGIKTMN